MFVNNQDAKERIFIMPEYSEIRLRNSKYMGNQY